MRPFRSSETTVRGSRMSCAVSVDGRSSGIPFWSIGAASMEMMRRTSMTSTSGVMLISAIARWRPDRPPPFPTDAPTSAPPAEHPVDQVRAELVHPGFEESKLAHEVVVADERRDRGEEARGGRDERLGDAGRVRGERRGAGDADAVERVHDPPDRAEEADEG